MDAKRVKEIHPCFGAKQNRGRIHLPVCPGCNLACRFCDRKLNDVENRPGVTAKVIEPEEAAGYVEKALQFCPELSVVGIAGPGDTLASDQALETFRLIGDRFPQLLKCMSTNGLLLAERAEEVIDVGIDTLTVTVNGVDPSIVAKIINGLIYHGRRYEGEEAGKILIHNQLEGIRKVAAAGVVVKVNTVLVNEINRFHIGEIAKTVKAAGASIYNIIPLIPQHDLKDCEAPSCVDLAVARKEAGEYIDVFRHCQHCRADAVGVPGKSNFSRQVYQGIPMVKETFSHG
ncbi:radical SAM protein [Selenomonas ruminis]|nr:radical SAM protein [Selenomonas sp. mPRGC5]